MKHILLLTFIFSVGFTQAQDDKVFEFPMKSSSLLWKISGDSVNGDSYLFGTVHMIPKSKYYFPDTLKHFSTHAKEVVLEIDLTANMMGMYSKLMLEKDSLLDLFTTAQQDSIFTWFQENMSITPAQFKMTMGKMKPFVISTLIAGSGSDEPMESYDMNISAAAKQNNIPVSGLETLEDQLELFDSNTTEEQVKMVMEAIRSADEASDLMDEMVEVYISQDVDSLFLFATKDGTFSVDQDAFLDKRNALWIPKIKKYVAEKSTFIAVGAGHLGGPNGVIRLLQKQGYTLTPIEL